MIDNTLSFEQKGWDIAKLLLQSSPFGTKLHHLRDFLGFVQAASKLADDRPRDFSDLQKGWAADSKVRATAYAARHNPGGRSLVTGGIWSKTVLVSVWPSASLICRRRGEAVERRLHRLWQCPANEPLKTALHQKLRRIMGNIDREVWTSNLSSTP